jgi:outer membrane protein OmpA-like peptidoglycan-associated protein/tetratricopeptide (TPR) repeat protein
MKKVLVSFIFTLFFYVGFTQNVDFSKSNFPNDKEGLKTALKNLQEGDGYYYAGIKSNALDSYLKAQKFNPKNAELNAKIGDCYLKSGELDHALTNITSALKLDPNLDGFYYFLLAKIYHANNDFSEAIKEYKSAKLKGSKINPIAIQSADKKIKECKYAEKLVATPVNVEITNVSSAINTANHEYVPVITADESEMFFTSRRENSLGGLRDPNIDDYYEDIYYSVKEKDVWSEAKNIGAPINSNSHDATVGLSIDGQKLFIYRDDKSGDGNIFVTERKGNDWTEPTALPKPINSKSQETSACYDYTGKTIYFVSDRPKGFGGKDIYKSTQLKDGSWGEAENLGSTINSVDDEDAIFLHPDGKTLYFSSNGENTMGGFDIFKSVNEKGKWSKPVNLGVPINSADDDVCFVLTANGEHGYYTSQKVGGQGKKDIYRITFLDEIKNNNRPKLTLLKGIIFDSKTKEPLSAMIEIYDNEEDKLVASYESNSASGKYMVSLPAGHNYGISVKKKGYLFHSENVNIPDTAAFQEIEKNIGLNKLEAGKKIVLMNIFYDYNKASLRNSSFNELDKVVELLSKNPKMKVELGAHSDSRGGDAYNLKLSQERAQSCVDYLTSKGIDKSRLNAKGYGEAYPIIPDAEINKLATEKEKEDAFQQNRRTEFKILAN